MPGRRQRDGERVLRLANERDVCFSASDWWSHLVSLADCSQSSALWTEQREFYGFCVLGMLILRSREDDVMSLLLLQIFESAAWILVTLTCSSLCLLSRIIPLCSPGSLCCGFSLSLSRRSALAFVLLGLCVTFSGDQWLMRVQEPLYQHLKDVYYCYFLKLSDGWKRSATSIG